MVDPLSTSCKLICKIMGKIQPFVMSQKMQIANDHTRSHFLSLLNV